MLGLWEISCNNRSIEYPNLEGTHKDHSVQTLLPHKTTQKPNPMSEGIVQMLLELWQLRAVPTALGSPFHAHRPLVQTLSLTPSCPSPGTAPCHSLRSCLCHREQSSALPLHSQWGSWEMGRLLKDCDQLSVQKIQRQNWKSFLIRDKDLVGTAELRNT